MGHSASDVFWPGKKPCKQSGPRTKAKSPKPKEPSKPRASPAIQDRQVPMTVWKGRCGVVEEASRSRTPSPRAGTCNT